MAEGGELEAVAGARVRLMCDECVVQPRHNLSPNIMAQAAADQTRYLQLYSTFVSRRRRVLPAMR